MWVAWVLRTAFAHNFTILGSLVLRSVSCLLTSLPPLSLPLPRTQSTMAKMPRHGALLQRQHRVARLHLPLRVVVVKRWLTASTGCNRPRRWLAVLLAFFSLTPGDCCS